MVHSFPRDRAAVVTIIGAGMMGSALSFPLRDNGQAVRIVGTPLDGEIIASLRKNNWHPTLKRTLPDGISYYTIDELGEAMDGTDLFIGGVSSFGLDWFRNFMIPKLPEGAIVLSITKGMMDLPDGTLVSYPELYEQARSGISFNAVGGPCTSYELADRDPTTVCFCGRDIALLREIKRLFATDYYHISLSEDVRGVECAVAMKNAYALGVSLAIGMSYKREGREFEHYNSQAALFGQSVKEMRRLLELCGGLDENIRLGAGDLYVTVFGGRTRKIGILLGEGMPFDDALAELKGVTLESIVIAARTARAVRALCAAGTVKAEEFPLLFHVDALVTGGEKVNIPWEAFETETVI